MVEDPKAADAYFFFFRLTFAAFFLLFAMLPSWYQSGDVAKCSRESTCTAFRLHQSDKKNSDLAECSAFAALPASRSASANDMCSVAALARALHKIAALARFSDNAKTRINQGFLAISGFEILRLRSLCTSDHPHCRNRAANASRARVFARGKFFTACHFLVMRGCAHDQN